MLEVPRHADPRGRTSARRGTSTHRETGGPAGRSGRLPACRSPTRRWWCWSAPPGRASRPGRRSATATQEVVSSDALRGVVGSGPHDLDASADAFAVLEAVVAARLGRRLTTVVDTLGFDAARRRGWLAAARVAGLPAVLVRLDTPDDECRRRNAARDRPAAREGARRPAGPGSGVADEVADEGWDLVAPVTPDASPVPTPPAPTAGEARAGGERTASTGVEVVLQVSRFPWGEDPLGWLRDVALAADEAGFSGLGTDGPPDPDPPGRAGVGPDPRALGGARRRRRPRHRAAARHALHADHVPTARDHRQGRGHPVGPDRRTDVRRHRCGLVGT